jgi:hypothetical protein
VRKSKAPSTTFLGPLRYTETLQVPVTYTLKLEDVGFVALFLGYWVVFVWAVHRTNHDVEGYAKNR